MDEKELPRVELRTEREPVRGMNTYQAIPETVEFNRSRAAVGSVRTLGLGRVALTMEGETGELVGLRCHVKTGRWKTGEAEAPPEPDAEGVMAIAHPFAAEDILFLPAEPRFFWHDGSRSLRISFSAGMALVLKVADCLLAGVDRKGRLTDIWMLDLDLSLE